MAERVLSGRVAAPRDHVHPRTGLVAEVFALLGLAASIYLTVEHFTGAKTFACPATSAINCEKVTTSAWSHLATVPVAVLGLVYFVVLCVLCLPPAWRRPVLDLPRIAFAAVGVVTALYLVWAELFRI